MHETNTARGWAQGYGHPVYRIAGESERYPIILALSAETSRRLRDVRGRNPANRNPLLLPLPSILIPAAHTRTSGHESGGAFGHLA
jgi:hypothetical protein